MEKQRREENKMNGKHPWKQGNEENKIGLEYMKRVRVMLEKKWQISLVGFEKLQKLSDADPKFCHQTGMERGF